MLVFGQNEDEEYERAMRFVTSPTPLSQQADVIIPPVLYLPVRVDAAGQASAVVHRKDDGKNALLAFTALDRLGQRCGMQQPWIMVHTEELGAIKEAQPFDVVAFDPQISPRLLRDGSLA